MSNFLGWFDDNKRTSIAERIEEGRAAYIDRFHTAPAVVLVNEEEARGLAVSGILVISKPYIRKNNYWLGASDC